MLAQKLGSEFGGANATTGMVANRQGLLGKTWLNSMGMCLFDMP
ncbi:MAG: hypothetical protein N838_03025 [Thiohalocapsa sp. PB-PSB1]|nr:MAG: hypothetical protein N838_03025 [Thiohalocapsa sp. PB-PSB1]